MIGTEARGAWRELEARLRPYVARRVASAAYRIAEHAIADSARARARHPLMAREPDDRAASAVEPAVDDDDLESALGECVALFVARLPSPYREAVTLTELEGLGQKQAAQMLGLSLSGMKSRVQRGRQKIRAMFEECCEISVDCRGRVTQCDPRSTAEGAAECEPARASEREG